jgi:NUBPL iron-transfer P-loop NTPase
MRAIDLYLYASVKGGVGKSTLAVLTAKLLASQERHPVVLDADLLGSSLADGLELCAPVVHETNDTPDYGAPPTGRWHDLQQTRALRESRKHWWAHHGPDASPTALAPAFFNDALLYSYTNATAQDCRVDAMLWRHASDDHIRYLPSSPLRNDAMRIAPLASGDPPHFGWARRFVWLLDSLVEHDEAVTDVIIDLPPGTWGLAHETLVLASKLGDPLPNGYPQWHTRLRWRVVPTLVTTPDRNDRLLAMEYWLMAREKIPALRVLMNRAFESSAKLRADIRADVPEPLRELGLEDDVEFVSVLDPLSRVFVRGDLTLDRDLRELSRALRLERGGTNP